ncbi:MAG: DUF1553 domain-containing protein [Pirellulales bacterium]
MWQVKLSQSHIGGRIRLGSIFWLDHLLFRLGHLLSGLLNHLFSQVQAVKNFSVLKLVMRNNRVMRSCAVLSFKFCWTGLCWTGALISQAEETPKLEEAKAVEPVFSKPVDYSRDIRPILSDHCYACHGPDAEQREAGLRLDIRESAFGEADSGQQAVLPGDATNSELFRRLISHDPDERMPPEDYDKSLTEKKIEQIRQWIDQGASWQTHWAFTPPIRPELPTISDPSWPENPIDSFIMAQLDQEQLKPATETDREILLRRVTFDLTGLPPTLAEIDAFLADDSTTAYEQVIDRLLRSPHYGEHMARFWLDAARYGDTHGLHLDNYREIWPYRDWVVRAFNKNMPYDQFTIEQLAGDLLTDATLDQRVATGFCRCNVSTSEGGSIEEEVYTRNVVDRVTTMGTVFLGLTLECTRCHDHKFDPLTMNDFYSLFAFFNSIDGPALDGNHADTPPSVSVPTPEQDKILEHARKRIAELQSIQVKHRQEKESTFQLWVQERRQLSNNNISSADIPSVEGLIGHYPLDTEPDGKVTNRVTPESAGKVEGAPDGILGRYWVPGRYGTGVKLSAESYVDLGDVFDLEHNKSFSAGIWVWLPGDATGTILSKTNGKEQRGYALQANKGQLSFFLAHKLDHDAIQVVSPENVLTPNCWHHLLVTYDGSAKAAGITLYIDGNRQPSTVKQDSLAHRGAPRTIDSGAAHFVIGRLDSKEHPLVDGQVDELRIYNQRLSSTEAVNVMFSGGVGELLAQTDVQTTTEQWEELRQYYFNFHDTAYAKFSDEIAQLSTEQSDILSHLAISLIWREREKPRDAFFLKRGEYDQKGDKVERATPALFTPLAEGAPRNRLGLAQWLVERENPLTARVAVNRFWSQIFGTGLVKTAEDFGSQGDVPSHPELLDWLAVEFIESGWDVKGVMKVIVLSSTYQQSSKMTPILVKRDPENRLLAHGPRFRLDAEMLRDQALAVSGALVKKLGGPGVKPPQPDGLWFAVGYSGSNTVRFVADTKPEQVHRRTLYTFLKRTSPPPQMSTFDAPSREACIVRRERTNTPLQALLMLNDPQYVEAAKALAERVVREGEANSESRIRMMLRLCTGRNARQAVVDELNRLYHNEWEQFKKNPESAKQLIGVTPSPHGPSTNNEKQDTNQLAAWTMVANVVLNLDEVITKN